MKDHPSAFVRVLTSPWFLLCFWFACFVSGVVGLVVTGDWLALALILPAAFGVLISLGEIGRAR